MTTHNKCYLPIFKILQRSICTTIIFTFHVLFQISEVFEILGTNVTFIHLISMFIFMVPLKIIFTLVSMITLVACVRIGYTNYFIDILFLCCVLLLYSYSLTSSWYPDHNIRIFKCAFPGWLWALLDVLYKLESLRKFHHTFYIQNDYWMTDDFSWYGMLERI